MASLIDPKRIRIDLGTQMRIAMNDDVVKEYAEAMQAGCEFPALRAYFDEPNDLIILADGFHRLAAHNRVRPNDQILVELVLGTAEDAQWESIGANKSHGLRRTNEDKRNAVKMALSHPKGAEISDNQIAKHVGVSHTTVQNIRRELEVTCKICKIETRTVQRGDQVYQQKTARIGFGKTPPPPDATCSKCVCYKNDVCTNDDQRKLPWSPACEDFGMRGEDIPNRAMKPPDYDNIVICGDKTPYKRSDSMYQNRRLKNCLKVYLPSDNPAVFAVELRNRWSPEYLTDCIAALKQLLMDKGD
jgi:hypothetical protein